MKYDLIVFGGGTAGVSAAYIASKLGIKTLLVEKADVLGGSITQGLVIPVMKVYSSNINTEFYTDLLTFANKYSAQHTYIDNNSGWFNPELLKMWFYLINYYHYISKRSILSTRHQTEKFLKFWIVIFKILMRDLNHHL